MVLLAFLNIELIAAYYSYIGRKDLESNFFN